MKKSIVITGVSSGIGLDAASLLVQRGYRVFGSVRKESDGQSVKSRLGDDFIPLMFDVTDHAKIAAAVEQVRAAVGDGGLTALVNNSGIASSGPLMHIPLDELRKQMDVNVIGLLAVTQAFLPLLGARRDCPHPPGRVINISSASGGLVFPFVGAYSASKFAVEALSDGLRLELGLYGINVVAIEPGMIRTPIWDEVEETGAPYAGTDYRQSLDAFRALAIKQVRKGAPPSIVSQAILRVIEARRPKARVPLTGQWWLGKLMPTGLRDRILRKSVKLP
ncbi:MAG: SDR family oxidoreductase [Silvibacterium sp.]|nr:SDR family oxidoreductase [Silvibacterium sp.]